MQNLSLVYFRYSLLASLVCDFFSLAKKLNVSFYHYIHDRISAAYDLPSLADSIFEQAHTLDLDASWLPP